MPAVIDSFSLTYDIHRLPIKKGFGPEGEKLEDFLHEFRQNYCPEPVLFADPDLSWQMCQYGGLVCVGIFSVFVLTEDNHKSVNVGIISTNVHHMETRALEWLNANRQPGIDGRGYWHPAIEFPAPYDHCATYPIKLPEGMR
jgi:hypothetical protein|uniref:Uncharacterized protein n=1 Tax=Myoviridae sp. ctshb19 TaxID=2825194 RepID=A0A8S5UGQ1_9CAUD|nr:MAG TPA: hypothetical protein [Myoviridae sp. ctshb19]